MLNPKPSNAPLDFNTALSYARTALLMHHNATFIGSLLLQLKVVPCKKTQWIAVSGLTIYVNTDWFMTLTKEQRMFALAHETWHVGYGHTVFKPAAGINSRKLNVAQDHVINLKCKTDGFTLIDNVCADPQFKDKTTAEVYELLPDMPEDSQDGMPMSDDAKPGDGDGDGDPASAAASERAQQMEWANAVQTAATMSDMSGPGAGKVPEDILRTLQKVLNPALPWWQLLRMHMNKYQREGYDFNRRNRRSRQFYMPTRRSRKMGAIRAYVDSSYSTTQKELSLEVQELEYLRKTLRPEKISMTAFAYTLGKEQVANDGDGLVFKPDVSGGTDLYPVWFDIMKKRDTEVVIIFTDGEVSVPEEKLNVDLIFVIVNNPKWTCKQGRVLHMEIDNG